MTVAIIEHLKTKSVENITEPTDICDCQQAKLFLKRGKKRKWEHSLDCQQAKLSRSIF